MKKVRKIKFLLLLKIAFTFCEAQNLVSNGYFETYSPCPTATSSQSNMQINYALGWSQSTLSPDYFNSCAGIGNGIDVPYSFHGFQQDCCGGGGFAGGYMFTYNTTNDGREYIQTTLNDTVRSGHKYLASMYLVKADFDYSIATAGMIFTDTSTYLNWPQGFIPATPQVLNNFLLSDTLNWILVQDTFVANGNKTILTIGNFNTSATSDSIKSSGTWGYYGGAYYYIDGVSVYDVTSGVCNNLWDAGFDKYIFAGDSIRLGAINTDNSTFVWQNSVGGNTFLSSNTDARPWSTPIATTTYYVTKNCGAGNIFTDTVTVYVAQQIGINAIENNFKLSISPNPAVNSLTLQSNSELGVICIYNMLGELRFKSTSRNQKAEIDISVLPSGVYMVLVQGKYSKFIKE